MNNKEDITKMYSNLCIPLNQLDSISVQVTLPKNNTLRTYFALWDTILDVKYYILPFLQPKIGNIQQIRCFVLNNHQQVEINDHTFLKNIRNNGLIQIMIKFKQLNDIEKKIMSKKILGYHNKITGKLYKNMMVQTVYKIPNIKNQNTNSLATQTIQNRDATNEVAVEFGTQTETISVLRSLNITKEITAYQYVNSHKSNTSENYDKCSRIIQKSVQKWMSRKKFEKMLHYYNYLKNLMYNEEKNLINNNNNKQQQIIINLQYPTKDLDFEALHSTIHNYYKNINKKGKFETPKSLKIENKIQFENQFKCIREITKHRIQAKEIAVEKKIFKQLNEISKTTIITKTNGKQLLIETLETNQAKQFMKLFISLKRNDLNKNERIQLLLKLQQFLDHFKETDLTRPIINLIERELTMLKIIQLNDTQLQILRRRIEVSIQWFLKQPEINPAIKKLSNPKYLVQCYSCRKLKPLNQFEVKSDLKKVTTCRDCKYLHRITTQQINLMPYEDILKNIKVTEAQLCAKSSLAYALSIEDIYYLVKIIWKGKSAISESKNIIQLKLVRWNNKLNWSPSNTILLAIQEAYDHSKIQNVNIHYTKTFINSISIKHIIAKNYFKSITEKTMKYYRNLERQKHMHKHNTIY